MSTPFTRRAALAGALPAAAAVILPAGAAMAALADGNHPDVALLAMLYRQHQARRWS